MNATSTYDPSGPTSTHGALYGLPTPLNDEDGGSECYPTDENEIDP